MMKAHPADVIRLRDFVAGSGSPDSRRLTPILAPPLGRFALTSCGIYDGRGFPRLRSPALFFVFLAHFFFD